MPYLEYFGIQVLGEYHNSKRYGACLKWIDLGIPGTIILNVTWVVPSLFFGSGQSGDPDLPYPNYGVTLPTHKKRQI